MDFFWSAAKFLTHGLIVLRVGKHFSRECKRVGWEESGSNWFLIQQGKAQHCKAGKVTWLLWKRHKRITAQRWGTPREQEPAP